LGRRVHRREPLRRAWMREVRGVVLLYAGGPEWAIGMDEGAMEEHDGVPEPELSILINPSAVKAWIGSRWPICGESFEISGALWGGKKNENASLVARDV
jgi:hypothetical protein